jgi:hypothetical protein
VVSIQPDLQHHQPRCAAYVVCSHARCLLQTRQARVHVLHNGPLHCDKQ